MLFLMKILNRIRLFFFRIKLFFFRNRYRDCVLKITAGACNGELRTIQSNTSTMLIAEEIPITSKEK